MTTTLFDHTPYATAPVQPVYGLGVQTIEEGGERTVVVGGYRHTMDQARELVATIQAAIAIGEAAG